MKIFILVLIFCLCNVLAVGDWNFIEPNADYSNHMSNADKLLVMCMLNDVKCKNDNTWVCETYLNCIKRVFKNDPNVFFGEFNYVSYEEEQLNCLNNVECLRNLKNQYEKKELTTWYENEQLNCLNNAECLEILKNKHGNDQNLRFLAAK